MHEFVKELKELCESLEREIEDYNKKFKVAGRISAEDLKVIDQLTHSLKSGKTTMAMMEGGSERGYYADGSNEGSYRGGSFADEGGYNRYYMDGSGRRGRDSMGRYVSRSSYADDISYKLREIMERSNDDRTKQELRNIVEMMGQN
jgi:hypothetical protein